MCSGVKSESSTATMIESNRASWFTYKEARRPGPVLWANTRGKLYGSYSHRPACPTTLSPSVELTRVIQTLICK